MTRINFGGTGSLAEALANGQRLLLGQPGSAEEQAREILRIDPLNGDALRLLAAALRWLGRIDEAEQAELDAIRAAMHEPVLAQAAKAISKDRLDVAEHLVRPYLRQRPTDVAAIGMLAEIANRTGIFDEAEALLRRAMRLAPAFVEARLSLSRLLFKQNRNEESLTVLDEILAKQPNNAKALRAKATALSQTGHYEQAIAIYEALLARAPQLPPIWLSYGHVLKTVGRLEDAVAAYRRALTLAPDLGEAWWSLGNLKTVSLVQSDVQDMAAALASPVLDPNSRFHLHFALGKALEDTGQVEECFSHYSAGNRIRRSMIAYDPELVTAEVHRSRAFFTPTFFAERHEAGCPAADPIFVLGLPRAGSTLVEQILASHSQVEGTAELPYIPTLARQLIAKRWKRPNASYPQVLAEIGPDALRALGEEYLDRARAHRRTNRPFFIDKLPNNWADIGFIHLILPNARIVDVRRHPLSCCFSNFKQHFARGQAFSYSLEEVGRYYRDYVSLLRHFDKVLPGRVHRVIYERLVQDPEREVRALLRHLGLDFEEACLRFYENERAVRTASSEQVRQPIYRGGLNQWKTFEPWLGPLKEVLGPVLEAYPDSPAD